MHDPISVTYFGNKSSPHRPYLPMQTSSRLYYCSLCHSQVIICTRCDRGQRYCANDCRQKARQASLERASKKYQKSRSGRFTNAARQKRFRQRKKHKVTHHGSLQIPCHDVLKIKATRADKPPKQRQTSSIVTCHHCGAECRPFLQHDFLRSHRFKPGFRRNTSLEPYS